MLSRAGTSLTLYFDAESRVWGRGRENDEEVEGFKRAGGETKLGKLQKHYDVLGCINLPFYAHLKMCVLLI